MPGTHAVYSPTGRDRARPSTLVCDLHRRWKRGIRQRIIIASCCAVTRRRGGRPWRLEVRGDGSVWIATYFL